MKPIGNRTQTPYFWLQTIELRTSNIVRPITSKDFQTLISECHLITCSRKMIITGECTLITKIAMLVVSSGTMVANSLYIVFRCNRSEWLTGMPICILSLLSLALCSRYFQIVKLRLQNVGILQSYCHSNFM